MLIQAIRKTGPQLDTEKLIDTLENKWGKDAAKGPQIQDLRGRLFLSQGKLEDAEKWVSDLWSRDKKGAAGPAGQLARALDQMGADKFKQKADSLEGEDLWKRAAKFYYMSIKPQVDGLVTQDADEMAQVGGRNIWILEVRDPDSVEDEAHAPRPIDCP